MPKTLRLKDGFSDTSPELRDEVKRLQQDLKEAGCSVDVDGFFGQGTEDAVKEFQQENGLTIDGIAGPATRRVLEAQLHSVREQETPESRNTGPVATLGGFHGDLSWVHAWEGHAGKAYWPGGASGVTLDPGVDLGHAKPDLIEKAYKELLTPPQFHDVKKVLGIKGEAAKKALKQHPELQKIRISREQADGIMQFAAKPYWDDIVERFQAIGDADTPGSVQTAMLSIAYNRGAENKALDVLADPIAQKDWKEVAKIIGAMQQDHRLPGIRKRRRMEAELILKELG